MEMTGTRTVPAPVETVWAALNDPATLRGSIPGCDVIEPDGDSAYRVAMAAKVGPVSAKFSGRMQLTDVDPPCAYTLSFNGQEGAAGFATGEARVTLAPADGGVRPCSLTRVRSRLAASFRNSVLGSWKARRTK